MTRPEPHRADTFDLQAKTLNGHDVLEQDHADFVGIDPLEEEDDEIYDDDHDEDEDEDEDDDADALSSSPSIPDDDIDFDFMYALHSFAATVEGQANATKGDMLVLLDDSNSYWWLVRVVKDHTVGYLPAETIETPYERLARLNKHRNIDRTAVMLEDHSPTNRSGNRKPFRRKGGKSVVFNNSCTYYQLDAAIYDSSDGEEGEDEGESIVVDDKLEDDEIHDGNELESDPLYGRKDDFETDGLLENEEDGPHPSPRMGMESADGSGLDHAGRKVMRIRDLNDERPTSAIFRDSKLEPLKISVTPSIARDRVLLSPDENGVESAKNKNAEDDRKRSLSISSVANSDSGAESDAREKENAKKGRKNSVFGNLFRKRSKKASRDEDTRDDDVVEAKEASVRSVTETDTDDDSVGPRSRQLETSNFQNVTKENTQENNLYLHASHVVNKVISREETPVAVLESDHENLTSPATQSSTLPTPSLPWSDASVHSFLDYDTSIRDAIVLIYEGSRLRKRSSVEYIDPQIADIFGSCAVHIDEMSSHLDDVLTSYIFGVKTQG